MILFQRLLQLIAAFFVTLLTILIWYMMSNPIPSVPVIKSIETNETASVLLPELTEKLGELGIEEKISEELPAKRLKKLQQELSGLLAGNYSKMGCQQYALIAVSDGLYPCYNGLQTTIFLKRGEVWKYGKTCIGEQNRYPGGLPYDNLLFVRQFAGSELQCLIVEKIKIYNYLVQPENIARAAKNKIAPLFRPPGNRIDR